MISVNFADLEMAFEFVSSGIPTEHRAYISIDTGAIFLGIGLQRHRRRGTGRSGGVRSLLGRTRAKAIWVWVGSWHSNLRKNDYQTNTARSSGSSAVAEAYGRFKDLLASHGQLDAWYVFEAEHTEHALREWCEAHEIKAIAETRPEEHGSA